MNFKKIGAETILSVMIAPFVIWFLSFVLSTYQLRAEVENQQNDLKEIKQDVREIKNFLITKGDRNGH